MSRGKQHPLKPAMRHGKSLQDLPYNSYKDAWANFQNNIKDYLANPNNNHPEANLDPISQATSLDDFLETATAKDLTYLITLLTLPGLEADPDEVLPKYNKLRGEIQMALYLRLSGLYKDLQEIGVEARMDLLSHQIVDLQKKGADYQNWMSYFETIQLKVQALDIYCKQNSLPKNLVEKANARVHEFEYNLFRSNLMDMIKSYDSFTSYPKSMRHMLLPELQKALDKRMVKRFYYTKR